MAPSTLLRLALIAFVVLWLLGPDVLRSAVPVWLAFAVALGLELQFFIGALRSSPRARPDRRPQAVDRARFGYAEEPAELLLVREQGEELWVPYSGESDEELDELIAAERERPDWEPPAGDSDNALPPALRRLLVGLAVIGGLALLLWFVDRKTGWQYICLEEEWTRGYLQEIQDFMECVTQKREPLAGLALAHETIKVNYAAYWSADEGRRVTV